MDARKKILKTFIIVILAVFLLSTALISVMYLGGTGSQTETGSVVTGDTNTEAIQATGDNS